MGGKFGLSVADFAYYAERGAELMKLRDGDRLFELGTGCGGFLFYALQKLPNLRVSGVDISENMARAAIPGAHNGPFCQSTAAVYPFVPANSFDGVVAAGVMQYMPTLAAAETLVAEMLRVAKPGARILVTLVNDLGAKNGHWTQNAILDKLWVPRPWWSEVATRLHVAEPPLLLLEADTYRPRTWWDRAGRYSVVLVKPAA